MLLIALAFSAGSMFALQRLDSAVRAPLYDNFLSIESTYHMEKALHELELSEEAGTIAQTLPTDRQMFQHWFEVEEKNVTEPGEKELVASTKKRWLTLLDDLEHRSPDSSHTAQFAALHDELEKLAEINKSAMFRADVTVASGNVSMPAEVQSVFLNSARASTSVDLTQRESEIVRQVANGFKNAEVASRLSISESTVKTHLNNIFQKLGLRHRTQLVRYALRAGVAQIADLPG